MQKPPELSHGGAGPEAALLIACARRRIDARARATIVDAVQGPIDWARLLELARRHRLIPLLHWHLGREAPGRMPPATAAALRRAFELNAAQSLRLTAELRQIFELFAARGIPILPYKGPILAQQLYGNVALRQMGDLDVLVRARDVNRARAALAERGFESPAELSAWQERAALHADSNVVLVRRPDPLLLELHWSFAAGRHTCGLDWEALEPRLQPFEFGTQPVRVLGAEDLLLVLAFHGARHMWERLEWIAGVAELIRGQPLDWQETLARADTLGLRRMVLLAAELAEGLLDAPLPDNVHAAIRRDPVVARLGAEVRRRMFSGNGALAHTLGSPFHWFQLRSLQRLRHRARYLLYGALAPSKEDWDAVRLPGALFPLYLLVRPFRLAADYGRRLTRQAA